MSDPQRDESAQQASNDAAIVGERLTGERDARDPDGLLTVDQIAGGSHGASPEEGLSIPRDGRIEEPSADASDASDASDAGETVVEQADDGR
jgi:hypothetical protein